MDDAPGREIAIGRDRRPAGEADEGWALGRSADTQNTGRVEYPAEDLGLADRALRPVERVNVEDRVLVLEARFLPDVEVGAVALMTKIL